MNEESTSLPRPKAQGIKSEEIIYKRSKRRTSSCGCNKRTKRVTSSTGVKRQQVSSIQNHKSVNQRKQTSNPDMLAIKKDNPALKKNVPEKQSTVSSKVSTMSYTSQQQKEIHIEESSTLNKVLRYCKQLFIFKWLTKRNNL